MDHGMGCVLRARTQMQDRKDLRTGVDGQPQPQDVGVPAQPGAQFVQLEVREVQMAAEALVQGVCVLASSGQPDGDGGLSKTEDPWSLGRVQPTGSGRQDHRDLVRGSFQTVQEGAAPGSERAAASRASKGLDPFDLAMLAIPKKPRGCEHQ
jgi:hypothetical protein